jgi:hypothetical protein
MERRGYKLTAISLSERHRHADIRVKYTEKMRENGVHVNTMEESMRSWEVHRSWHDMPLIKCFSQVRPSLSEGFVVFV